MKYLLILVILFSVSSQADEFDVANYMNNTSFYVGASYKFQEKYYAPTGVTSSPIGARIGITYQYSEHLSFGIDHHSQWLSGYPVNNKTDVYSKTEIFIDYKFTLANLLGK